MNFTQLSTFRAIAHTGSITKAAQLLRVSQPAVSKHLKNLEHTCGRQLVERSAGKQELTDAGRILLRHADAIFFQLDVLKNELNLSSKKLGSEPLNIAGSYAVSALLLPSVLATFKKKHPEASIVLRTGTTRDAKSLLLNLAVDIALINEPSPEPNLVSEPFRLEQLVLFVAPYHPLAKKKRPTIADFNAATLITPGRASTVDKFLKHLVHQGISAKISIRCGTPESVKTMVKKGVGVGILFKDLVIPEIRKRIFKRIEIPQLKLTVQSYIVYHRDQPLAESAREFLMLLKEREN